MKHIKYIVLAAVSGLMLAGCKKGLTTYLETESTAGKANLKIVHASAYTTNYSVRLKVNDAIVSGVITYSTPFPGGGLNTGGASSPWYLALTPGNQKISIYVPKVGVANDSIPLFTGTISADMNKYYSAYLADTLTRTQLVLVEDNLTTPARNTSRFRFVNLMPNQAALDLYWGQTKVASSIAYASSSPEFTLTARDTAHFYIRTAGAAATSSAIAFYPTTATTSMQIPTQRVMTVYSRGYSGATGNRAPNVSLSYNK